MAAKESHNPKVVKTIVITIVNTCSAYSWHVLFQVFYIH